MSAVVKTAWAIRLGLTDLDQELLRAGKSTFTGHGYMGVLFFGHDIPVWHDGCRTALFRTRQQARDALKERGVRNGWPRVRVERVKITIEPLAEEAGHSLNRPVVHNGAHK